MNKTSQKTLPWWATVLLILGISIMIELLSIYIQPGVFRASLYSIVSRPLLLFLNFFPVLVFVCIGYFLFKNVFWGALPSALIFPLFSYVNLLKIEGREDAFVPADIALFREALSSTANYSLNMHWKLIAVIVLFAAFIIFLGFHLKSTAPSVVIRIGASIGIFALFVLSVHFLYSDKEIYNSFEVPAAYNIPSVFNNLGFNYCFLYNINLYSVDKPEGYNKETIEEWEKEYAQEKTEKTAKPHVIFVMGEAFSDLSNNDVFAYQTPQDNPIYLFNQLAEREQAISGKIVVSNIAAGTANTEFDIMTGMPTNMISDTTTSSFRVIHKSTPSLASMFSDNGYSTYFMHPGMSWFYNRNSVYQFLGMDDLTFSEAFNPEQDNKGPLISDEAFLRQLKADFEERHEQGPLFSYNVSIQNHQAYNYEKYPEKPNPVPLHTEISDRAMEFLSVYMEGAKDTAKMMYDFAEYADNIDEPIVLVYFGDHLPNLGEDYLTYKELGISVGQTDSTESILSSYETPFLIYANKAYYESVDFKAAVKSLELPENGIISDIYLGAAVCELIGFSGEDAYFDFLNQARRQLPVFREKESAYILSDGTYTDTLTDENLTDIIHKIDWWEYYRLN